MKISRKKGVCRIRMIVVIIGKRRRKKTDKKYLYQEMRWKR